MDSVLNSIMSVINNIGFLPFFFFGLIFSVFIFWRESKFSDKDRNSVFDMWFLVIFLTMLWGRISFIIANWGFFGALPWSLAPYERYGNDVYFFRLLPWKFFDLRDGGFLFTSMFAGYLLVAFVYTIIVKKWRWREMFMPVVLSAETMLSLLLTVYGAVSGFRDIFVGGLSIAGLVVLFLIVISIFRWKLKERNGIWDGVLYLLVLIFMFVSFFIITRMFLSYDISEVDKVNVYIMNFMAVIMTIYFIFFEKRSSDKAESMIFGGGKSVTININKPVKVSNDKE